MIIDRDARNHVGLLTRKLRESLRDEKDGLAHRHLHRLLEVRVKAHHDSVGRRFAARPRDLHVFTHDELELATQSGFDGGEIDLTLRLGRVGIADESSAPGA